MSSFSKVTQKIQSSQFQESFYFHKLAGPELCITSSRLDLIPLHIEDVRDNHPHSHMFGMCTQLRPIY